MYNTIDIAHQFLSIVPKSTMAAEIKSELKAYSGATAIIPIKVEGTIKENSVLIACTNDDIEMFVHSVNTNNDGTTITVSVTKVGGGRVMLPIGTKLCLMPEEVNDKPIYNVYGIETYPMYYSIPYGRGKWRQYGSHYYPVHRPHYEGGHGGSGGRPGGYGHSGGRHGGHGGSDGSGGSGGRPGGYGHSGGSGGRPGGYGHSGGRPGGHGHSGGRHGGHGGSDGSGGSGGRPGGHGHSGGSGGRPGGFGGNGGHGHSGGSVGHGGPNGLQRGRR